ncbi:MAG: sorbosone dehydrogenase family protein, partial [Candidatus Eisenbacteria bacterium]|nr:sorbosone dehydrogenase family protein [Candidatus Eisenbacteria bacterium]
SWNRSQKIGYRVVTVEPDGDGRAGPPEVFAEGWLRDGSVSGRPVDVLALPDGSLLVSDDYAGAIYRVTYTGKE